jgi:multisubunit Na+/H+ antiporter MnhF subunit
LNPWQIAAMCIAPLLLVCADMCLRGSPERRLVGMQMTSILVIFLMVLLTIGWDRYIMIDLPLALAIMSFGGGLVFARFLEKHL